MKYFLFFLLISCGGMDFKKVEELSSFRILGIVADSPELSSVGGVVQLDLIVSDVSGTELLIEGTYESCLDPGISFGAPISCDHDPTSSVNTFQIDMTSLLPDSSHRTGKTNLSLNVLIPPISGVSERELFNGVSFIVIFEVNNLKTFKRILVTSRNELNQNPVINDLLLNGSSLVTSPKKNDILSLTSSLPESYSFQTIDNITENRTEELQVAWYSRQGSFNFSKVFVDEKVKFLGEEGTSLVLALIRDGRGGLDFKKFSLPE